MTAASLSWAERAADRSPAVQRSRAADRIGKEQERTKEALVQVRAERDTARTERDRARRLTATLSLRQGQALDAGDDPAGGLLWMARALSQCPADDAGLPPEYAIAGKVETGLDVVDRIGKLGDPTTEQPTQTVEIEKATVDVSK